MVSLWCLMECQAVLVLVHSTSTYSVSVYIKETATGRRKKTRSAWYHHCCSCVVAVTLAIVAEQWRRNMSHFSFRGHTLRPSPGTTSSEDEMCHAFRWLQHTSDSRRNGYTLAYSAPICDRMLCMWHGATKTTSRPQYVRRHEPMSYHPNGQWSVCGVSWSATQYLYLYTVLQRTQCLYTLKKLQLVDRKTRSAWYHYCCSCVVTVTLAIVFLQLLYPAELQIVLQLSYYYLITSKAKTAHAIKILQVGFFPETSPIERQMITI